MIGTCSKQKEGTLSAFASRNRHSESEILEDENDPYIREQDNYFDEVDENGELNKRALKTLNALNKESDDDSDPGNVEEITFHEFDEETMDRRTMIYDEEDGIGEPAGH